MLLNGHPVDSLSTQLENLENFSGNGSPRGEILAVRALMAAYLGDTTGSLEIGQRALEHLQPDDYFWRDFIVGSLGLAYLYRGDLAAARSTLEEAFKISQRFDDIANMVQALTNLAETSMLEGKFREAKKLFGKALSLSFVRMPRSKIWSAINNKKARSATSLAASTDNPFCLS